MMVWWRRQPRRSRDSSVPGLSHGQRFGDAEFHPINGPHAARHPVNMKWLASLLLLAGAAAVMLGAIWTWLGAGFSVALVPEFARPAVNGDDAPRADRLAGASPERGIVRSRIEQLADDVHILRRFNYVMVHLAQAVAPSSGPKDPGDDAAPSAGGAPGQGARYPNVASAIATDESLPPEIRFGASRSVRHPHVSAYADEDAVVAPAALPGVPINLSVVGKSKETVSGERHVIVARRGNTLESMLSAIGVTAHDAQAIAAVLTPSWFGRASFAGGEVITVLEEDVDGEVRPRQVELTRDGKPLRMAVLADDGTYVKVQPRPVATPSGNSDLAWAGAMLRPALDAEDSVKLDQSFDRLARDNRLEPSLVNEVMRLCAQDVEHGVAIARDDTAEMLYSSGADGRPVLAFAALTHNGSTHRYYRFTSPDDGDTDYYDSNGRSVTGMLMKKPVASGRLGDGFGWRVHPILRDRRFHDGVDYAAPYGAPILAAGDGVMEYIGEEPGYGKYVRVRHDFGYETTYAHISGVPQGLKIGARIHRGQTIAYVGSTGLSTGPHLYYELRVNGHYADPLQANLRAGRVLDGGALAAFEKLRRRTDRLVQTSALVATSHP